MRGKDQPSPHFNMPGLDFNLEGAGPAGIFESGEPPRSDGRYRYMPYRSGSHHAMQCLLDDGKSARCYYESAGIRVSFSVRAFIEYGELDLYDFRTSPLDV